VLFAAVKPSPRGYAAGYKRLGMPFARINFGCLKIVFYLAKVIPSLGDLGMSMAKTRGLINFG